MRESIENDIERGLKKRRKKKLYGKLSVLARNSLAITDRPSNRGTQAENTTRTPFDHPPSFEVDSISITVFMMRVNLIIISGKPTA